MSQEPPDFRYYVIKGDALEVLKAYQDELDALFEDRQRLAEEFSKRNAQQDEYHHANLQALWRRLTASVGLTHEETWGSPEYQIETRYVADGFGAILYVPRHVNPMQKALANEPIAKRSDPETDVPPPDTTRH
jgi:RNAse (barnase) inhibitor barstar